MPEFYTESRRTGRTDPARPADVAMAFIDDEPVKKKTAHEIGQDVALVSIGELEERIALLRAEIARLETEVEKRRASRSAADAVFRL